MKSLGEHSTGHFAAFVARVDTTGRACNSGLILSSDDLIGLLLQPALLQSSLRRHLGGAQPEHSEVRHKELNFCKQ